MVPFYRQHAGAFLFLFFILFGIHPSAGDALKTHYYIIIAMLGSPLVFLLIAGLWLLYTLKTVHFFRSCLSIASYDFIYLFNAIPPRRRIMHLARLQLHLFLPVAIYGVTVIFIAWREAYFAGVIKTALVITCLYALSVYACFDLLQKAKGLQAMTGRAFILLPRNLFGFLTRFIFVKQLPALIVMKLVSFSSLYFFTRMDNPVFEDRILWLLYITLLVGHSFIIFRNFSFIERELRFYRNLPLKGMYTIISLLAVYLLLLLPEIWALRGVAVIQHRPVEYVWMILTGPALLLLLHCLLYTEDMKMEEFLKLLFGIWVVFIFFSLANHWLIPLTGLVFAPVIFFISYRQYEKEAEVEGIE